MERGRHGGACRSDYGWNVPGRANTAPVESFTSALKNSQLDRLPATITPGITALNVVDTEQVDPMRVSAVEAHVMFLVNGTSGTVPAFPPVLFRSVIRTE